MVEPLFAVLIATAVLLVLIAVRLPVAFALLASGFLGVLMLEGTRSAAATLARLPYQTPARYVLVVIPLFIAMGVFAKSGRLAEDSFAIASRWLARFPGGLALASVAACAMFAAVSGSSVATVATLAPMAVREMRRNGYDERLAAGVVGAAGTLGVLIPPSVALVLYGIVTQESIGRLLIAGIIPGVLSAAIYGAVLVGRVVLHPELVSNTAVSTPTSAATPANTPVAPLEGRTPSIAPLAKVLALFVVVVGSIYAGFATVTEAASLGAILALGFFLGDIRRNRGQIWSSVTGAFREAVILTCMAFALLIGASFFTYLLVSAGVARHFTSWVIGLDVSPLLIIVLLLLAFIPLGMFLDPLSLLLVGVPLAYPVVTGLGFDGIWFGILVVKTIEIGLITPPFGINAYVVAGSAEGISVDDAFRGILWFLPVDVATTALLFLFPVLVLWLPSVMG